MSNRMDKKEGDVLRSQPVITRIDSMKSYVGVLGAVLSTLRFSREIGLVFCGVAGFFEGLRVACFWACCK